MALFRLREKCKRSCEELFRLCPFPYIASGGLWSVEEDDDDEADDVRGEDEHDEEDQPPLVVEDVSQESGEDNHLLSLNL